MAKMYPMVDMAMDDEEILDATLPTPIADMPRYPWGLRICLTQDEFDKLGLDPAEATVGGIVHLHALARITSYSCDETQDGQKCRCELQIEDLAIESEDDENEEADAAPPARKSIYSKPMA